MPLANSSPANSSPAGYTPERPEIPRKLKQRVLEFRLGRDQIKNSPRAARDRRSSVHVIGEEANAMDAEIIARTNEVLPPQSRLKVLLRDALLAAIVLTWP